MSKLAPPLETALQSWRLRAGPRVPEGSPAAYEQVVVIVTYEGDVEMLREAGLVTGLDRHGVVSGRIPFRDLERLAAVPSVVYIETEPDYEPLLDGTVAEMRVPWKVPPDTPWPGRGAGVIVAVIDTGIDIFHESFQKTDGTTRILELWDQSATSGGSPPPTGFDQQAGRVFSAAEINAGIAAGPPFASVDTSGHGTHVAGIAAGNGRQDDRCSNPGKYIGVAPEADLVVVKAISLPAGASPNVREALQWCAEAGARHGNKPVVINCSFGSSVGPHDGTGFGDRNVDRVLRPPGQPVPAGVAIVCSAGNNGNSEIHENGTVPPGDSRTVSFRVPPGSDEFELLDIWYNGEATLEATLTAPPAPGSAAGSVGPITPGAPGSPFSLGTMRVIATSSTAPFAAHSGQKQISIRISVQASTTLDGAIVAGATSITVQSASDFPSTGNFRIRIGQELMTVTGGQGTQTWTATRAVGGTTAAAHTDGATVQLVSTPAVRAGVWQIALNNTSGVAANWRAWFRSRHGPHATFRLLTELTMVERRRSDTVGEPGSSLNAITVANYSNGDGRITESSSRGREGVTQPQWQASTAYTVGDRVNPASAPTGFSYRCEGAGTSGASEPTWPTTLGETVADGAVLWEAVGAMVHELKPTIAATGAGVAAPRSRDDDQLNSSCCDQKVVDKTGTSMSAPHVAGLVALMLEKNRTLTFEIVRAHLQRATRVDGIPAEQVPPVVDPLLEIRWGHIWGSGKANAAVALADIPAAPGGGGGGGGGGAGGGGGGGGGPEPFWDEGELGYTPHTIFSRLGEWNRRLGPRPGLMLMAALVSEHFDEVLRLVNQNRRVGAVWRREGGPHLARHLLFGHHAGTTLMPSWVDGHEAARLFDRFLPVLDRYGSPKLKHDIERYAHFVQVWPGASLDLLDEWALEPAVGS